MNVSIIFSSKFDDFCSTLKFMTSGWNVKGLYLSRCSPLNCCYLWIPSPAHSQLSRLQHAFVWLKLNWFSQASWNSGKYCPGDCWLSRQSSLPGLCEEGKPGTKDASAIILLWDREESVWTSTVPAWKASKTRQAKLAVSQLSVEHIGGSSRNRSSWLYIEA